jgi:hypothetical protein
VLLEVLGSSGREVRDVFRAATPTHRRLRDHLVTIAAATLAIDLICATLAFLLERHSQETEIKTFGSAVFWTTTQLLTVSSQIKNGGWKSSRCLHGGLGRYCHRDARRCTRQLPAKARSGDRRKALTRGRWRSGSGRFARFRFGTSESSQGARRDPASESPSSILAPRGRLGSMSVETHAERDERTNRDGQNMAQTGVQRGSERVALACKAMSAACADLRVACVRDGMPAEAVEGAADALDTEAERVCELAEQLGQLAEALATGWGQREAVPQADLPVRE